MKRLFLLVPLMLFIVFGAYSTQTQAQEPQRIHHTMYANAYYFYESEENWYMLTLEYMREDENRVYFGGFISDASEGVQTGKWISGSVPKNSLSTVNKTVPLSPIVY